VDAVPGVLPNFVVVPDIVAGGLASLEWSAFRRTTERRRRGGVIEPGSLLHATADPHRRSRLASRVMVP
jgi:hypothetical protein